MKSGRTSFRGARPRAAMLGLLAMLWLCAAFYVTTVRALWRAPPGPLRAALGGLSAAVTALLIAFQLTP